MASRGCHLFEVLKRLPVCRDFGGDRDVIEVLWQETAKQEEKAFAEVSARQAKQQYDAYEKQLGAARKRDRSSKRQESSKVKKKESSSSCVAPPGCVGAPGAEASSKEASALTLGASDLEKLTRSWRDRWTAETGTEPPSSGRGASTSSR